MVLVQKKLSLPSLYRKEREGIDTIEFQTSFFTYSFLEVGGHKTLYVIDVFIEQEHRSTGLFSEMLEYGLTLAKENGCKLMLGTVDVKDKNATKNLSIFFKIGFKLESLDKGTIFITKEVQ